MTRSFRCRLAVAAALACAALAPPVHAGTVSVSANGGQARVSYAALPDETNTLTLDATTRELPDGGTLVLVALRDTTAPLRTGAGCLPSGIDAATCTVVVRGELRPDVELLLGNRDDVLATSEAFPLQVRAGGGTHQDRLTGGAGADLLVGERGSDRLAGGAGDDELRGGDQHDVLDGGAGADRMYGEASDSPDTVDYSARRSPVEVSLDGLANDGAPGEGDLVATDFERVLGGSGDDALTAGPDGGELHGGDGDDTLAAAPADGRSVFFGDAGDDVLRAGDTPDNLSFGGPGNDVQHGGTFRDWLIGGPGDDVLRGDGGPDRFVGEEGADVFEGGAGNDSADYFGLPGPIDVTLDGVANDGAAGEGDDVEPDVETVLGTTGDDRIVGSDADNSLFGADGADTLVGGGGDDLLDAGLRFPLHDEFGSPEHVSGGDGDDWVLGANADDVLEGGAGADRIVGYPGDDSLDGGAGADRVVGVAFGREAGTDALTCGPDFDVVEPGPLDLFGADCEEVR